MRKKSEKHSTAKKWKSIFCIDFETNAKKGAQQKNILWMKKMGRYIGR